MKALIAATLQILYSLKRGLYTQGSDHLQDLLCHKVIGTQTTKSDTATGFTMEDEIPVLITNDSRPRILGYQFGTAVAVTQLPRQQGSTALDRPLDHSSFTVGIFGNQKPDGEDSQQRVPQ